MGNDLKLNKQDLRELNESLHYCKMSELKVVCNQLKLSDSGKKGELIHRIQVFVESGDKITSPEIPPTSKSQRGKKYPLHPETLMMYGAYKNDYQTRAFFKDLIGDHFHFTAYGIDWLNERWLQGKPPTYAEFAAFWQKEHEVRKKRKAEPKKEWAYINFIQRFLEKHPRASKAEIVTAWEQERQKHVKRAKALLVRR